MDQDSFTTCLLAARKYRSKNLFTEALAEFRNAQAHDPFRPELVEYIETLVDAYQIDRAIFEATLLLLTGMLLETVKSERFAKRLQEVKEIVEGNVTQPRRVPPDEHPFKEQAESMGIQDQYEYLRSLDDLTLYKGVGCMAFDLFQVLEKVEDPFWLPHLGFFYVSVSSFEDEIISDLEKIDSQGHAYPWDDEEAQAEWAEQFQERALDFLDQAETKYIGAGFKILEDRHVKCREIFVNFVSFIQGLISKDKDFFGDASAYDDLTPELNFLLGEGAMYFDDTDTALYAYRQIPKSHPFHLRSSVQIGTILKKRNEHLEALKVFRQAEILGKPSEVLYSATLDCMQDILIQQNKTTPSDIDPAGLHSVSTAFKNPFADLENESFQRFVADLVKNIGEQLLKEIHSPNIQKTARQVIQAGESENVEFKETLHFDVRRSEKSDNVLQSSLKNIAAFLNTKGGTLLIGVSDDGKAKGLEPDFKLCQRGKQNRDGLELKVRDLIKENFSPPPYDFCDVSFEEIEDHDIMKIVVRPKKAVTFLKLPDKDGRKSEKLYIRDGNRTIEIEGPPLAEWIHNRNS